MSDYTKRLVEVSNAQANFNNRGGDASRNNFSTISETTSGHHLAGSRPMSAVVMLHKKYDNKISGS